MTDTGPHPTGRTAAPMVADHRRQVARIIAAYDSAIIRLYAKVRFRIINIDILQILALGLRGKKRVLDVGCGFGLFGCYFASLYPDMEYEGYDLDARRVAMANLAAARLGLTNARFAVADARELSLGSGYDAILIIDLLHHLDDLAKARLLETCVGALAADGRLVLKEVTTRPRHELAFTWALDVLMTRGFEMWYWDEERFYAELERYFGRVDALPIADWLPYPHIVYVCEDVKRAAPIGAEGARALDER